MLPRLSEPNVANGGARYAELLGNDSFRQAAVQCETRLIFGKDGLRESFSDSEPSVSPAILGVLCTCSPSQVISRCVRAVPISMEAFASFRRWPLECSDDKRVNAEGLSFGVSIQNYDRVAVAANRRFENPLSNSSTTWVCGGRATFDGFDSSDGRDLVKPFKPDDWKPVFIHREQF